MRVTLKHLNEVLAEKLKALDIDFVRIESYRTRYRGHDYEAGASVINFMVYTKEKNDFWLVFCFYPIPEIQRLLDDGHELYLKWNRGRDPELALRPSDNIKKNTK